MRDLTAIRPHPSATAGPALSVVGWHGRDQRDEKLRRVGSVVRPEPLGRKSRPRRTVPGRRPAPSFRTHEMYSDTLNRRANGLS